MEREPVSTTQETQPSPLSRARLEIVQELQTKILGKDFREKNIPGAIISFEEYSEIPLEVLQRLQARGMLTPNLNSEKLDEIQESVLEHYTHTIFGEDVDKEQSVAIRPEHITGLAIGTIYWAGREGVVMETKNSTEE